MDISIIIVNYNVKHFLEQCLYSVQKALKNIKGEVFVVDNNSVDGSFQMVTSKFPWVKIIANKENVGFAKANNQAIKISKGRYVLLLNPDTFVKEDTLESCVSFCDRNEDSGGLGVKMIDGKGKFLPESKRALPTPRVAFFKVFGLSALFPKSKIFGRYHLGFLNKDEVNKVEILAGAFMLLRKSVLDKIGLLDETFFMYGEDIDLSYRIIKAGYNNYYYPDTTIIHYKGESTKKGSINYVMVFYKAMIIFAQKHFSTKNARLFSYLINLAIYFRAGLGILRRILNTFIEPVSDFLFIFTSFWFLTPVWERFMFGREQYYPDYFIYYVVPIYILIWMFLVYLAGGYERNLKPTSIFKGIVGGSLIILLIYALLPESLRFSRALILLGSLNAVLVMFLVRMGSSMLFGDRKILLKNVSKKNIVVVGSEKEASRIIEILNKSDIGFDFKGRISIGDEENIDKTLGDISQLEEVIRINKIQEVVFCSQDLTAGEIIETMLSLSKPEIDFKIAPPESVSVIGSNSINTAGDLYVVDLNSLNKGVNKRKKRMFDIVSGFLLILFSPILIFLAKEPIGFIRNCTLVLIGKLTWVSVNFDRHHVFHSDFRKGVLEPADGLKRSNFNSKIKQRVNVMYAKDYQLFNDLVILIRGFRFTGRKL